MRVLDFVDGTTVDGPGFRTSIYFAGCQHACKGCHNPQSWDMDGGYEISIPQIMKRIRENDMNVTFSGGDPLYQLPELIELAEQIKSEGRNIWCYTGFLFEQVINMPLGRKLLRLTDVLVDGPFMEPLRDTSLLFRGSSNQRLIDVPATLRNGNVVLWHSRF